MIKFWWKDTTMDEESIHPSEKSAIEIEVMEDGMTFLVCLGRYYIRKCP